MTLSRPEVRRLVSAQHDRSSNVRALNGLASDTDRASISAPSPAQADGAVGLGISSLEYAIENIIDMTKLPL